MMPIPQTNQGWIPDGGHHVVAIGLPTLKSAVPEILLDAEPSVPILLYRAYYDVLGGYPAYKAQEIGSCVGHAHAHAMDCLQCVEIALGEPSEYRETSAEFVYAASRAIAGILGPFDGSYGSAAVKALLRMGACSREMLGPDGVDSGRIAKAWGRTGPPDRYVQAAGAYKLGAVARITDRASAVSALWNGSPITICSSQGFTMVRDRDGCCKPSGRWDHCNPPEAMIWGIRPKRSADIRLGDEVLGHDGHMHRVSARMERRHVGDLVKISVVGHPSVRFTPEHPVLVDRSVFDASRKRSEVAVTSGGVAVAIRARTRQRLWVDAGDVRVGDWLVVPANVEYGHLPVATWGDTGKCRNIPIDIKPSPEFAWLLGLYIANGNADPGHRISITLPSAKPELIEAAASTVRRCLGLVPRVSNEGEHHRIHADSSVVANAFAEWFGGGREEKRIPEFALAWDLQSLIRGIHAGDGDGTDLNRLKIYTTSETLREQLWMLLVNLGLRPSIHLCSRSKGTYDNAKPMWAICFNRTADRSEPKRKNHPGYRDGYYVLPVKEVVREAYDGPVYNWEVEGSNSYISDGVAVHNCMFIAGYDPGKKRYLIVQSWGPNTPQGPLYLDQPDYTFWADAGVVERRIFSAGDSWALFRAPEFARRPLPSGWAKVA